jgi:FkbM family methyltransferase
LFSPDDHIGSLLRRGVPYEHDLLEPLSWLLSDGDTVVDVGANIGNHTAYFAIACNATVHAFEPNPLAVRYLRANVELNGLESRVHLHEEAVSDRSGRSAIDPHETELGMSKVLPAVDGPIRTVRLDDYNDQDVRLIKIDVEHEEEKVIRGAMELVRRTRPIIVAEAAVDDERKKIDSLLSPLGYLRFPSSFAYTPTWVYLPRHRDFLRLLIGVAPERLAARAARAIRRAKAVRAGLRR